MGENKREIQGGAGSLRTDLRTILNGLIPTGFDSRRMPPEAKCEVREALDAVLKLWDQRNARLTLALESLDRAAEEIERLKAEIVRLQAHSST